MTKQFPVVYEWSGRNFSGFAPDVPGCAATAKTLPKMRLELKGALEAHLEWMRRDGDLPPEPASTVTVDLVDDPEFPLPSGYYMVVERLTIEVHEPELVGMAEIPTGELTTA